MLRNIYRVLFESNNVFTSVVRFVYSSENLCQRKIMKVCLRSLLII